MRWRILNRFCEERSDEAISSRKARDCFANARRSAIAIIAMLLFTHGEPTMADTSDKATNFLGEPLAQCCTDPMTGFYRDGFCHTGADDVGTHTVCAILTEEFLSFTKSRGNDLSTPRPEVNFPGLKPGDGWCLCALRWKEAYEAGVAPPVRLEATHAKTLELVPLEILKKHAAEK